MAFILVAISVAAAAFAAFVLRSMLQDRKAHLDRIARATRPMHGKAMPSAPLRSYDRPGE